MPEPAFNTRQESMNSSFEGCQLRGEPNCSLPLRGEGTPSHYASDSGDKGKAVVEEGDTEVSGVTGKELMNVASSSSSSTVAEPQDNNLASSSSSEHDEAEDPTDVPEAPPMSMRSLAKTPMSESDARLCWRNEEPILFQDTPEQANLSSGLGIYETMRLMELPEEPQHDADPEEIPQQVQEPERLSTTTLTFQIPGFSMGQGGGIVPVGEEKSVEDPDQVGLENLNIFMNP